jgi:hypothetical protein
MSQECTEPQITRISFPLYPTKAVALGVGGDVKVKVRVNADGELIHMEVLVGNSLLVQAVKDSIIDIQFEKSLTEREVVLTYTFSIIPSGIEPKVKSKIRFEPPNRITVFENQIVATEGIPLEPNIPNRKPKN